MKSIICFLHCGNFLQNANRRNAFTSNFRRIFPSRAMFISVGTFPCRRSEPSKVQLTLTMSVFCARVYIFAETLSLGADVSWAIPANLKTPSFWNVFRHRISTTSAIRFWATARIWGQDAFCQIYDWIKNPFTCKRRREKKSKRGCESSALYWATERRRDAIRCCSRDLVYSRTPSFIRANLLRERALPKQQKKVFPERTKIRYNKGTKMQ